MRQFLPSDGKGLIEISLFIPGDNYFLLALRSISGRSARVVVAQPPSFMEMPG